MPRWQLAQTRMSMNEAQGTRGWQDGVMCGICGVVGLRDLPGTAGDVAEAMTGRLLHRGPDSHAVWADEEFGVALGHSRLAIRDLTSTGAQPMVSSDGRFVMVYNGEVYSQPELTKRLNAVGRALRGTSDTEAILESCARFGLEATIPDLIGMFAFALWDRANKCVYLVRDRIGIKPVYWAPFRGGLIFGSELKALANVPGWSPTLDRNAIASYMRHNYIPAPYTAYKDVFKLDAGTILKFTLDGSTEISQFWSARQVAVTGIRQRDRLGMTPTTDDVETLLMDAVRRRLVSDVPVGSLLSGGIDSSLVTALMAESSATRVRSYSIGFQSADYDEAPFASAIAAHLGTEHTELYVQPSHAIELVRSLPRIYDEPFADSSQLPSIIVSELTKQQVTVALTGDGGDEVFAGYNRYTLGLRLAKQISRLPKSARRMASVLASAAPEALLNSLGALAPAGYRRPQAGTKIRELARMAAGDDANAFYRSLVTHWPEPNALVRGGREYLGALWDLSLVDDLPDDLDRMQVMDMLTYLPDDILVKMDRASMSVGLEVRVPLLDHRLVELAWRLPQDAKIRDGQSKWVLREILAKRVPRQMFERPKMGFGIPIDAWLRGPLRTWAEDLLSQSRLLDQGLLDPRPIRARWNAHLRGENWAYPLWDVLMLQAWIEEWKPPLG